MKVVDLKISIQIDIWGFTYGLVGKYIRRWIKYFLDLRESLLKSRLKISLEAYVSFLFFATILIFISSFIGSIIYVYYIAGYNVFYTILVSLGISVLAGAGSFAVIYSYPSLKASSIASRIDEDLPYAIAHMNVLASAGVSPEQIIISVASVKDDAVAEFMKDVVRDVDLLGMDIITAIRNAKDRAPSRTLEGFLAEMEATISTGGDMKEFLSSYGREILGTKAIEAKEFSETLSTMAEVFIIMMVVFPLLMIVMLSIMSLVGGNLLGLSLSKLMWLITYLLVPIFGISFLVMLDQIMPRGE